MTHFDEMTCLLYLEGQLDSARSREIAAHAAECAACRSLLHALERETKLLSAALDEDNEPVPARLAGPQGRSVPSWTWTLAFGGFAAGAYWLYADGIGPWFNQMSNAGFGGTDLLSLILFSGAFWEGWSDMIDAMQIGALIVVGLFALGWIRRRLRRSAAIAVVLPVLLAALVLPGQASAAEVRHGRAAVFIRAGETVHNDLIVTGPSVRIDGTVEGDLIAFTRSLTVTGHVTGDVIGFGEEALIDGTVDGNLRVVSRDMTIQGTIGKNVSTIDRSVTLAPKGVVGGELIVIAGAVDLDGKIQHDLLGLAGKTELDGLIGGEASIRGGSLTVASTAEIRGPVTFTGREQPVVESGAKLASPIRTEITQEVRRARRSFARLVIRGIFGYGAALVVGIVLLLAFPGFFRAALREAGGIALPIGIGALALVSAAFLLALGFLLLLIGVGAGVAGVMGLAPILYVAQVFIGTWAGNRILGEASNMTSAVIGRMALGLLILHVVGFIPILGGLMWLVVLLWGTGAVLMAFYRMSRPERAESAPSAPLPA